MDDLMKEILKVNYELDNMHLTRRLLNNFLTHCDQMCNSSEYEQYYMGLWAKGDKLKNILNDLFGAVFDHLDNLTDEQHKAHREYLLEKMKKDDLS